MPEMVRDQIWLPIWIQHVEKPIQVFAIFLRRCLSRSHTVKFHWLRQLLQKHALGGFSKRRIQVCNQIHCGVLWPPQAYKLHWFSQSFANVTCVFVAVMLCNISMIRIYTFSITVALHKGDPDTCLYNHFISNDVAPCSCKDVSAEVSSHR